MVVDVVHHNEGDGGSSALVAVLVILVIGVAIFVAFKQGYLTGKDEDPEPTTIQINVPGSSPAPAN